MQLNKVKIRLKEKKIDLKITIQAKKMIAEMGFDPLYGARPLKRIIQKYILDPLSLKIIRGETKTKNAFKIDVIDKKIIID